MNNKEKLNEIVEKVKKLPSLTAVALRNKDPSAQIDLIIIIDKEDTKAMQLLLAELLQDYKIKLNVINTHYRNKDLFNEILRKGEIIYGEIQIDHKKLGLKPYKIVSYNLKGLTETIKNRISKRVHGRVSKKIINGKSYNYTYTGLKEEEDVFLISDGTLLLPQENAQGYIDFLRNNNVRYTSHDVGTKKAQMTIFIIIGLIILISGLLIFYISAYVIEGEGGAESQDKVTLEYQGQKEIKNYVEGCIEPIVLQALEIIRLQGGYIHIPNNFETITIKDPENKQVKVVDGSKKVVTDTNGPGNQVPYWLTKDTFLIPKVEYVENEIKEYVESELRKCVADFAPFKKQGYDIETGDMDAKVSLETVIIIDILFPIKAQRNDVIFNINTFSVTVPFNLKQIIEKATSLVASEYIYGYLEDHTLKLISLYAGVANDKLPPLSRSDVNFDCSSVTWSKDQVEEDLKTLLNVNMGYLKADGTNFTKESRSDPIEQGVFDGMIHRFFAGNYPNLNIEFISDFDFINFDILPRSGSTLKPDKTMSTNIPFIPSMCTYSYKFKYTMENPVIIKITDTSLPKIDPDKNLFGFETGYTFKIPVVSYICGNSKRVCTDAPTEYRLESANPDVQVLQDSQFCNPQQRISPEFTVNTYDLFSQDALGKVDVFYYCGSYENDCYMGQTDEDGVLITKFPFCINGNIYFTKSNYSMRTMDLTTHDATEFTIRSYLGTLREFEVDVKKIYVPLLIKRIYETGTVNPVKQGLTSEEEIIISASKPNSISYQYPDPNNRKIELGSGIYDLRIALNTQSNILETTIEVENEDDVIIDAHSGPMISGSLSIDWPVSEVDIRKDKVTFYVLADYNPEELNGVTWDSIHDPIIQDNGDLLAELLVRGNTVLSVDGDGGTELEAGDGERIEKVNITMEQLVPFIKPEFS